MVEGSVYEADTAVPEIAKLLNGGKVFVMDDEKTLILSAKGDGSLVFYTGCNAEEYWFRDSGINFDDKAQVAAWFKEQFATWNPLWTTLFTRAASHFIPRPQYCMPLDQTWEASPDLTLLGDAAHLMPPYAGEGVNMAMLDALELSESLTSTQFEDSRSAIAHYELQMRVRAAEAARVTLEQTAALHRAGAMANLIAMFKAPH